MRGTVRRGSMTCFAPASSASTTRTQMFVWTVVIVSG